MTNKDAIKEALEIAIGYTSLVASGVKEMPILKDRAKSDTEIIEKAMTALQQPCVDVERLINQMIWRYADQNKISEHTQIIQSVVNDIAERGLIGGLPVIEGLEEAINPKNFNHCPDVQEMPEMRLVDAQDLDAVLKAAKAYQERSKGDALKCCNCNKVIDHVHPRNGHNVCEECF